MCSDTSAQDSQQGLLRVYLLPGAKSRFFIFCPELHPDRNQDRGEANQSQGGLMQACAAAYRHLTRGRRSREGILRRMARLEGLEVLHPACISAYEAEAIYRHLLADYVRKHRRWLLTHGALLPVGVLFTLVPGPNVLLAYLAWRAHAHYRSKKGGQKALAELQLRFRQVAALDPLVELMGKRLVLRRKAKIRRIGDAAGIHALDRLY